ncbi:MAG TPA: ABC transporter permease [Baekduia sp.]|uniref:ABC transporter permease n=1 Tax=Baekduia sp. TaxID=2600305 RepID=UPI002D76ADF5|nr:ABC transporter permease [Baekduia sp.]HET6507826.1 ABC transporter permease [Baekduia sp.]
MSPNATEGRAATAGAATPPPDDIARDGRGRPALARVVANPLFAVVTGLIALVIAFSIVNGSAFASVDNVRNITLDAAITLVLAVGITYVIVTAGFDLSVGSVLVFSGVFAMKVMGWVGGSSWPTALLGLLGALAAGGAWGALNGWLVAYARLNPIIVTLGSLGAALGLSLVVAGGADLVDVPASMIDLGNERVLGVPPVALIALVFAAVAGVVLAKTVFGRHTYAIGSSKEAAERAGIAVERHLVRIYLFSGACAGLAGWLALARFSTTSISGHSLDALNAATAALLGGASLYGGVGTIVGTVLGAFIPVVLANGLVIGGVQSYWQQVVTGVVLVLAVYLDSERRKRNE